MHDIQNFYNLIMHDIQNFRPLDLHDIQNFVRFESAFWLLKFVDQLKMVCRLKILMGGGIEMDARRKCKNPKKDFSNSYVSLG